MRFAKTYPQSLGIEKISGKEAALGIGRIVGGRKQMRPNWIIVVVGQLSNLIFTASQSANNLDPLLQFLYERAPARRKAALASVENRC